MNKGKIDSAHKSIQAAENELKGIIRHEKQLSQKIGGKVVSEEYRPFRQTIRNAAGRIGITLIPLKFFWVIESIAIFFLASFWTYVFAETLMLTSKIQYILAIGIGFLAAAGSATLIHLVWKQAAVYLVNVTANNQKTYRKALIIAILTLALFVAVDLSGVGLLLRKLTETNSLSTITKTPLAHYGVIFVSLCVPLLAAILGWHGGLWQFASDVAVDNFLSDPDKQSAFNELLDVQDRRAELNANLSLQRSLPSFRRTEVETNNILPPPEEQELPEDIEGGSDKNKGDINV